MSTTTMRPVICHWLRAPDGTFQLTNGTPPDVVATVAQSADGWTWEARYGGSAWRTGAEPTSLKAARAAQRALKARHGAAGRQIVCRNQDIF